MQAVTSARLTYAERQATPLLIGAIPVELTGSEAREAYPRGYYGDLPTRIYVVCPDGQVRHGEAFATRAEAETFAEWGHACFAGNRHIVRVLTGVWADDMREIASANACQL